MKTPVLETERLILRPLTLTDAPMIQKYFNNWSIIKDIGAEVPWPYPDDGAESFLKDILPRMEKGETFAWAISLKDDTKKFLGQIAYRYITEKEDHRGFWLAEPYWGNGYMSEAIEAIQDFIFFDLNVDKIIVKNAKSNIASRRVKEKTGAVFLRETKGQYHSGERTEEIWEITKESWCAFRNRNEANEVPRKDPSV